MKKEKIIGHARDQDYHQNGFLFNLDKTLKKTQHFTPRVRSTVQAVPVPSKKIKVHPFHLGDTCILGSNHQFHQSQNLHCYCTTT